MKKAHVPNLGSFRNLMGILTHQVKAWILERSSDEVEIQ
jgi:hypothetical protein